MELGSFDNSPHQLQLALQVIQESAQFHVQVVKGPGKIIKKNFYIICVNFYYKENENNILKIYLYLTKTSYIKLYERNNYLHPSMIKLTAWLLLSSINSFYTFRDNNTIKYNYKLRLLKIPNYWHLWLMSIGADIYFCGWQISLLLAEIISEILKLMTFERIQFCRFWQNAKWLGYTIETTHLTNSINEAHIGRYICWLHAF